MPDNVFRDFLKKNEALFHAVVSQSGEGISVCSTDGRYLFVNDAFCSMTGYNPKDFSKMTVREFIPPETELKLFSKVVNQQTGSREVELVKKNGERFWVETRGYPIKIDGISYVIGTILDITKRKTFERQLRENEKKFRAAFHTSPNAINLNRMNDGVFVEINRGFTELMGYCPADVLGKSSLELGVWRNDEDRDAIVRQLQESGAVDDFEAEFVTKLGDVKIGLMSARIVEIAGKKLILSTTQDITKRKRVETERENLLKELQEALENVKTLSGMLPICASCKKIRDDKGYWQQIESYLYHHTDAQLSHGLCPDCAKKLYPEFADDKDIK